MNLENYTPKGQLEGYDFWNSVISKQNFDLFFERYPKKEY